MITLENGTITIKPQDLLLSSFLDAFNKDKSKEKKEAVKFFCYIHLASQIDPEAPFYKADPKEIKKLAKRQIYGAYDYDFKDSIYNNLQAEELLREYKEAYATPEMSILQTYDEKIYQYQEMLKLTTPEISKNVNGKTSNITYASNSGLITKTLTDMEKVINARDSLVAKMRQESKGDVRGQRKPSRLEEKHGV